MAVPCVVVQLLLLQLLLFLHSVGVAWMRLPTATEGLENSRSNPVLEQLSVMVAGVFFLRTVIYYVLQ